MLPCVRPPHGYSGISTCQNEGSSSSDRAYPAGELISAGVSIDNCSRELLPKYFFREHSDKVRNPASYTTATAVAALCLLLSGCMSTGWEEGGSVHRNPQYEKAGEVAVQMRVWNILFLKTPQERAAALLEAAEEKAQLAHGPEAILANLDLSARWSPYSLILGLNLLGFVEDAGLTADVLIPAPPLPPAPLPAPPPRPAEPEPEKPVRISYPVLPQERYEDGHGYIGLEYLTRPDVLERIKSRLDKRNARADEYVKEYEKVPPGGHLVVDIGRKDLMHANTRWYDFTIIKDGKTIIRRNGVEGIPNIKGRDGNWWNEVIIPLEPVIEESIEVRIADRKQNLDYVFSVVRLEEEM